MLFFTGILPALVSKTEIIKLQKAANRFQNFIFSSKKRHIKIL